MELEAVQQEIEMIEARESEQRHLSSCNICGNESFRPAPANRLSRRGIPPVCGKCGSLERHRILRAIFGAIRTPDFGRYNCLQFSRDPSVAGGWFGAYDFSVFGGLAEEIAKRTGLAREAVHHIQVPLQASLMKDKGVDNEHFPRGFQGICDRLENIPGGAICLVAAGLLGKYYCMLAKRAGAIAIDIGSIADVWAGKQSRPGLNSAFVQRWALLPIEGK